MAIGPYAKFRGLIEVAWCWAFPAVALPWAYGELAGRWGSAGATFVVVMPALAMYLMVAVGAGVFRYWYFTTRYSPRGVMLTIGLLYASVVSLGTVAVGGFLPDRVWLFLPLLAGFTAALGTFIDVFLLGAGILYVKSKRYRPGDDPIGHALSYGPWFFALVGLVNAGGIAFGYAALVGGGGWSVPAALAVAVPTCAAPFVAFYTAARPRRPRPGTVDARG